MSALTIVVLALGAVGLGAASLARGPRVLGTEANPLALIERSGGRLLVHTDRMLEPVDAAQVEVMPTAPFEVQVRDRTVELRFLRTLDYGVDYTVRVRGASGGTGAAGDLVATLRTPDPLITVLRREPGDEPDRFIRRGLGGGAEEVLHEAPGVQEAVVLAGAVAAIVRDTGDARPRLTLRSLDDPVEGPVATGEPAVLRDLRVSADPTLFGVVADGGVDVLGRPYADRLSFFDLGDPTGVPVVPTDEEGRALVVAEWRFLPGGTAVVLVDGAGEARWFDPLTGGTAPRLGATGALVDALPDAAVVRSADGSVRAVPVPIGGAAFDVGPVAPDLAGARLRVELDGGGAAQVVGEVIRVVAADGVARDVYAPAGEGSRIASVCASPNGEYLAVEVVSAEGVDDGVPDAPASTASTVYFIRAADGATGGGIGGIRTGWCG